MAIIDLRCNAVEELSHNPELLNSPLGRSFTNVNHNSRKTIETPPPEYVELAIVGGGIIGCGVACQILQNIPFLRNRIVILDSQSHLVQNYFNLMSNTGQKVMRSPYEHQIAPDGNLQMLDFARLHLSMLSEIERKQVKLGLSGQRSIVPLDIFIAHTTHVIGVYNLNEFAYQFTVESISKGNQAEDDRWIIKSKNGYSVKAKAVILATGNQTAPWNQILTMARRQYSDRVQSAYKQIRQIESGETIVVVGSGLTAGHVILKILQAKAHPVWIVRSEERYRCADFDTAYFRSEGIAHFRRLPTEEKVRVLAEENRGSLMLEFVHLFEALEETSQIQVYRGSTVEHVGETSAGKLDIHLSSGAAVAADRIIVATGLVPNHQLLPEETLLLDEKYPLLNEDTLEVKDLKNFHVAGALASLALGPAAKNIDGLRLASEIILPILEERFGENAKVNFSGRISGLTSIFLPEQEEVFHEANFK